MRWATLACVVGLVRRGDCYIPGGSVCLDTSFETNTGDWRTVFTGSKFTQWTRGEGSTPIGADLRTDSSGPSRAKDQSFYWYVETNPWQNAPVYDGRPPYTAPPFSDLYNMPDDTAFLESPMVSGASDLSFYHHMHGSGIGTLEVGS